MYYACILFPLLFCLCDLWLVIYDFFMPCFFSHMLLIHVCFILVIDSSCCHTIVKTPDVFKPVPVNISKVFDLTISALHLSLITHYEKMSLHFNTGYNFLQHVNLLVRLGADDCADLQRMRKYSSAGGATSFMPCRKIIRGLPSTCPTACIRP